MHIYHVFTTYLDVVFVFAVLFLYHQETVLNSRFERDGLEPGQRYSSFSPLSKWWQVSKLCGGKKEKRKDWVRNIELKSTTMKHS